MAAKTGNIYVSGTTTATVRIESTTDFWICGYGEVEKKSDQAIASLRQRLTTGNGNMAAKTQNTYSSVTMRYTGAYII